jgi:hypothetical protein
LCRYANFMKRINDFWCTLMVLGKDQQPGVERKAAGWSLS